VSAPWSSFPAAGEAVARKPTESVAAIAAAIGGRSLRGHSPAYVWMTRHFEELQSEYARGKPDWVAVTELLTKLEVTNLDGSALQPDNVRRTWGRVMRDQRRSQPLPRRPVPLPAMPDRPAQSLPLSRPPFDPPAEPEPFEFRTLGRPQRKKE
jgi:hypothetical protein